MSLLIAAYTFDAYKEFILPNVSDADYNIILYADLFGTENDTELKFESENGEWKLNQCLDYRLKRGTLYYSEEPLKDSDELTVELDNGGRISLLVTKIDNPFEYARKFIIKDSSLISIGSDANNHIRYSFKGCISRLHAVIQRQGDVFLIEDRSANGVFVNSRRINTRYELCYGDVINIFGLKIVFLNDLIAIYAYEKIDSNCISLNEFIDYTGIRTADSTICVGEKNRKFHRAPRNVPKLNSETIEIEAPPQPKEFVKKPILLTIGPAFTMAIPMVLGCIIAMSAMNTNGAFMYTGIITAVGSAVFGAIWALANLKHEKKEHEEGEEKRFKAYGDYLVELTDEIKHKYEENRKILHNLYPDGNTCKGYDDKTPLLWNRNLKHKDFLEVRVGIGDIPFQMQISIPKKRFSINKDSLSAKPELIVSNYKILKDVPINIDLKKHSIIGLVGSRNVSSVMPIVYNIAVQIAANHCYTDVKMGFAYDYKIGKQCDEWGFAKWLPHVWSDDRKMRYVASNKAEMGDMFYELTGMLRERMEAHQNVDGNENEIFKPHYVLFVENPELLENELISKYVYESGKDVGLTTILVANEFDELPNCCEYIIQANEDFSGIYSLNDDAEKASVKFDVLSFDDIDAFSRGISDVEVNELQSGGELPNTLDFFEMYKVTSLQQFKVLERWRKNNTYDTMRVLVGQKSGGDDCYLDIHEKHHGPHGLLAGTTGSGKSETLQTYMLSLALNYSPLDVAFFIIDFKGGGMANLFSDLPHTIGEISNLSGNQVRRAMISIKSENIRRQKLFSEYGVNHIDAYSRLLKNGEASLPIPHLLIIIDEFAELKREEPEFMRELISVAQVGRSLGVHLVLATQKPSGTVDDNIWSNAKFRLCLRVQDRQDSNDMLHKPDAAYITQAGRCYMQVGNDEVFEQFQSGWSGAAYRENALNAKSELAKAYSLTGKAELVGSRNVTRERMSQREDWLCLIGETILGIIESMGTSIEQCDEDVELLDECMIRCFDTFMKMHIDYPDTVHNRRCIRDLIRTWILVSGGEYDIKQNVRNIIVQAQLLGMKLPEVKEKTQLDAVVEYLADVAKKYGYVNYQKLWLPILPEKLYLDALEGFERKRYKDGTWAESGKIWSFDALVGLYDDPERQAQNPLSVDIAKNGHYAVCGVGASGKSTFMQTTLYSFINSYSPESMNVYILDFSSKMLSAFEDAPHVGGVMYENDAEKIQKFFHMMTGILEERKKEISGGSYSQYVRNNAGKMPAIIIAIDNFAGFREKTNDKYDDILTKLLRDGVGYGIFLLISATGFGGSEIPNRYGDNIRAVVCLEMGDKFKYSDAMHSMRVNILPESGVKGRGLAAVNGELLEFQTAVATRAEDDYQRSEEIKHVCMNMKNEWKGQPACRVPEIPEKPVWSEFSRLQSYRNALESKTVLPIGYKKIDASVCGFDLSSAYCIIVQGKARSGKTNLLKTLCASSLNLGGKTYVIDNTANEMQYFAESIKAERVSSEKEIYDLCLKILPEFKERNKKKNELMAKGIDGIELFTEMSKLFEPIWIIVADYVDYIKKIYQTKKDERVGDMSGFMENILEKGSAHNIYFIGGLNTDDVSAASGYKAFSLIADYHTGIHLGGNVAGQRIFDFSDIPFSEQSRPAKAGVGIIPQSEDNSMSTEVIIPYYDGVRESNE